MNMQSVHQYIQPIVQYFEHHPQAGPLFTFFIAFIESLPIVGTIFPGSVTMTAMGILIGAGVILPTPTLILACLGAFIGDSIGFLIGRIYQDKIKLIWPFTKYPNLITKSEMFFERHGGKSIIIGRFFGPARSTVPLVAGVLKLSWYRFIIAAMPSAIMWAFLYMTPGIILGALSIEIPTKEVTQFIFFGLIVIIFGWFVFWVIEHFFRLISSIVNNAAEKMWGFFTTRYGYHRWVGFISNKANPLDYKQLLFLGYALCFFILFVVLACSVLPSHSANGLNSGLYYLLQNARMTSGDNFFISSTFLGEKKSVVLITALIAIVLFFTKHKKMAYYLVITMMVTIACGLAMKSGFYSPRPPINVLKHSSSFPSGHTLLSFVLVGLMSYFVAYDKTITWRWISYGLAVLVITLVALSRIYIGAHWLTDVIGSCLLGACILTVSITLFRRQPAMVNGKLSGLLSYLIVLLFLIVPFAVGMLQFSTIKKMYSQEPTEKVILEKQWWDNSSSIFPLYRHNRLGKPFLPLNVQWAQSLTTIHQFLIDQHWYDFDDDGLFTRSAKYFVSTAPQYHQPIFPWLYQYQKPVLTMYKATADLDRIVEINLWPTHILLSATNQPILIGTIVYHGPAYKRISFRKANRSQYMLSNALSELSFKGSNMDYKIISMPVMSEQSSQLSIAWDNQIILIKSKTP